MENRLQVAGGVCYVVTSADLRIKSTNMNAQDPGQPCGLASGLSLGDGWLQASLHKDQILETAAVRANSGDLVVFKVLRPPPQPPLFASARALSDSDVLFLFHDPKAGKVMKRQHLEDWFNLTPTEAAIAVDIASGEEIDGIADKRDLSRYTVRSHLRAAFRKLGCNRQAELVRLVTKLEALI